MKANGVKKPEGPPPKNLELLERSISDTIVPLKRGFKKHPPFFDCVYSKKDVIWGPQTEQAQNTVYPGCTMVSGWPSAYRKGFFQSTTPM